MGDVEFLVDNLVGVEATRRFPSAPNGHQPSWSSVRDPGAVARADTK
jgi:hypothetical protein